MYKQNLLKNLSTQCVRKHVIYSKGCNISYWLKQANTQPSATVETQLKRSYRKARQSDPSSIYSVGIIIRHAKWSTLVKELKGDGGRHY